MNKKRKKEKFLIKKRFSRNFLLCVLFFSLTFIMILMLDMVLRYTVKDYYTFYNYASVNTLFFTISACLSMILILLFFKKNRKKIIFNIFALLYLLFFVIQFFHYSILEKIFNFADIGLTAEASKYFSSVFSEITLFFVIIIVAYLLLLIICNRLIKITELPKLNKYLIAILLVIIIMFQFIGFRGLGHVARADWEKSVAPKNIFVSYGDRTRALIVSGMPEYIVRAISVDLQHLIYSPSKKDQKKKIDNYVKENPYKHENNKYTGVFNNKNVVYIMLESIDTFLINEETMPTLYKLQNEGMNFTNRYAPTFGNGKTFNTEFSMITGMYQATSNVSIEKYLHNSYEDTFPKIFKENGYSTTSMHMNDGNYYNRKNFHELFGFEKHYCNLNEKYNNDFTQDSNVAKVDETYRNLVPKTGKFANMFITYSAHLSYRKSNKRCGVMLNKYPEYKKKKDYETACLYAEAHETDMFIKELIKRLEKEKKLDDTVLVFATDHYAYGYSQTFNIKKENDSKLISKVPFIIWNNKIKHKNVDTLMDTADILPTVANMFGVNYNPKYSSGTDVFSENHEKFVYFEDYSWYDGKTYYKNDNSKITPYIKKTSDVVNQKIDINNLILETNYYK